MCSLYRSVLCLLCFFLTAPLFGQGLPSIAEKTKGFEKKDGFFPVYWDESAGKIWLEIPTLNEDFLYVSSLPAGLGSNDIGLDRGQLGSERVVRFERVGPKVLLVTPNLRYRADSEDAAERRSVQEAFAEGTVWGFKAAAETRGRVLVDATDFVVRDAHGVIRTLKNQNQGTYTLDKSRSAPHLPKLKAFPENTEMEARLTFVGNNPGRYVRTVAADPYAFSVRVRHSFVKLPPPGYEPRAFDPRSGFFGPTYKDYAIPIGEDMTRRFISRHRLQKKDPNAPVSEAVEPIVYYLDPGTPEPVRGALLDGARWWAEAFEAAGFKDGFRVEMLPEGADPMDVRYNMIQWVHRATRGWSYGSSVNDPRTGEIIKGHVSLGSLRIRQDYLIAEGLLAPYGEGQEGGPSADNDPMLEMALARIRQLSAHEIGHTLGITHNFAASFNDRASVMDYPAPLATVSDSGTISIDDAYDTGIGEWDVFTIRYGYTQFRSPEAEKEGLRAILDEAHLTGYHFITDSDARPPGAANPISNLWDNGTNVIDALENEMNVRRVALSNFGLANIREDRPLATLEEVLVPLYLRHRYQVDATVKLIGGVAYSYAMRGDLRPVPSAVSGELQETALETLLATITPEALRLPVNIRAQIPPRPPGFGQHRELFDGYTGLTFDPYAPAEVAAGMVLNLIIHPERAARLAYQNDFDEELPGLNDVLAQVTQELWESRIPGDAYDAELQRIVQQVWVDALLDVASRPKLAPAVRSRVTQHLRDLHAWLEANPVRRGQETIAHRALIFDQIDKYLFRLYQPTERRVHSTTPPGSPIGQDGPDYLSRQHQRQITLERWDLGGWCGFSDE